MTTTYVPLKYAKKAMREVREESLREGERRGYARATEFVRMASSLNGSTHAVLKALQEEGDGLATPHNRMVPVDGDGAAVDGAPDGDLDAVLMAALDALTEAKTHHPETDGGPVYAYLAGLLADPEALADALAEMDGRETVTKAMINGKEKFGCLTADLPRELGDQLIALGRMIPDSDLGEDGRETTPHVTVRYGFHDEVIAANVKSIVETWEEALRIRLDHPECFYGKDSGKPYDVIVFAVDSEQLHYLHDALGDLPHTDTHAEYRPHATVAYVKAGFGDKWLKRMVLPVGPDGEVRSAVVNSLVYSDAYRNKTTMEIGNPIILKAFDESLHPRGDNGRFIGREQIHAAKSDPKLAEELRAKTTDPEQRKKLDAALAGEVDTGRTKAGEHRERVAKQRQDRQERVKRAQELANEISMWRRGGEAVPSSHFRELAEVLPSMTVAELRSVRGKLAASFGGDRRKAEMAARLLEHAKNKAALLETNERNEDMDALDFGSLHEYQNEGNAKGNEARNPNPEEQHGGRMQQRHDLMGAGAKGELNAPGKLSHGTPDTGSVLKLGDKPAPPPQTEPSKLVTPDKPDSGSWSQEPSTKQPHEMTRAEFVATGKHGDLHREAVENAIDAGKVIPPAVLKDYPRLQAEVSAQPDRSRTAEASASASRLVDSMKQYGEAGSGSEEEIGKRLNARGEVLRQLKGASEAGGAGARSHSDRIAELIADNKKDISALEKSNTPKPTALTAPTAPTQPAPKSPDTTYQYGPESVTVTPQDVEKHRQRASSAAGSVANSMFNLKTGSPTSSDTPDAIRKRMDMIDGINRAIVAAGGRPHVYDRQHFEKELENIVTTGPKMGQLIPSEGGQRAKLFKTSASDTPMSPAVHNAIKDAVKHHKRMQMPGKPVPQMVVYHIPEHRNTGGQLIEPAKVNAVPVNSYTGEQLLSGKLPHLKIEGTFEVGADGVPKKVDAEKNLPKNQVSASTTVDTGKGKGDTTPVEPQPAAPKQERKMSLPEHKPDPLVTGDTRDAHASASAQAKSEALAHAANVADAIGAASDEEFKKWAALPANLLKLHRPVVADASDLRSINRDLHTPLTREKAYLNLLKKTIEQNGIEKFRKYVPPIADRLAAIDAPRVAK